jgi:hypothetical protein
MPRTILFTVLVLIAAYALHAALLASWSLARDSTLSTVPRFGRMAFVWLVPLADRDDFKAIGTSGLSHHD